MSPTDVKTKGVLTHFDTRLLASLDRNAKRADMSRASYIRKLASDDTDVPDMLPGHRWGARGK